MLNKDIKKLGVSSAVGAGSGIILASVLTLLLALVLTVGNIPAMLISPVTSIILALGSFCGGFIGVKISGKKGFFCGGVSGIIFFLTVWIIGGIFESAGFGTAAIIKAAMVIIAGALGGIIGVNYIKK